MNNFFLGFYCILTSKPIVSALANATMYFVKGTNARIICPLVNDYITWTGPPDRSLIAAGEMTYTDDFAVIINRTHYSLEIKDFTDTNVGLYVCETLQETYSFLLRMHKAPSNMTIENETSDGCIKGYVDRKLSLKCQVVSGTPKGTLYWTYNNSVIKKSHSSSLTYSFQPSVTDDLAALSCVANNSLILQRTIKICLYLPPNVQIIPSPSVSVIENTKVELNCIYSSNHDITSISWIYNDRNFKTGFNSSNIELKSIRRAQAGEYACTVKNHAGTKTANVTITVLCRPKAPSNVQTIALTKTIIVKWHAGQSSGLQQMFYIEYRKHLDVIWKRVSAGKKSTFVISKLEPDTAYILRMYGKTVAGESNRTDEIILATGKRGSEGLFLLAVIPGILSLLIILSCFGLKAFKNGCCFYKNEKRFKKKGNEATPSRLPAQYDEIDSLYYNPMNDNIARPAVVQRHESEALLLVNRQNVEIVTSGIGSCQKITIEENNSPRTLHDESSECSSSADESYLVPCRQYIELEVMADVNHNENQREHLSIDADTLSDTSQRSDTNVKSAQKYETLLPVTTEEHSYK